MGGRGASSGSASFGNLEFGYPSDDNTTKLFPSAFNTGQKFQSVDIALKRFRKKHANSKTEYAVAIDKNGYARSYSMGGRNSFATEAKYRQGSIIIHNHPSGSNFSGADLRNFAQTGEKGVIATGKNGTYRIEKTSKFKASSFDKAIHDVKVRVDNSGSYNRSLGQWLSQNQNKYGYKYSHT